MFTTNIYFKFSLIQLKNWSIILNFYMMRKFLFILYKKVDIIFYVLIIMVLFSSVQSLSCVQLFVTPWTGACQASLSLTNSRSSPKLMSIESVMPSNHLIHCRPLLLLPSIPPSIRVFSNESTLLMRWQIIGVSASSSVLLMNTQDWSPLEWTSWISFQSKELSNATVQKHQFFGTQLSL